MTDHSHDLDTHQGTVRDVFGHRFVLATDNGPVLANVGPHAPEGVTLTEGAKVKIVGNRTPCEIKVHLFQTGGQAPIAIAHGKHKKHGCQDADPTTALRAAREAGYAVSGTPRRKAKHFEVDAARCGKRFELHITLDGDIRKERLLAAL